MQHHFDVSHAEKYGIAEAVIINHMQFWIKQNEANDHNYFDGHYWTFNSMAALAEMFPYLTEKKLRSAINHLKDEGILLTANYNRSPYDRTLWYTLNLEPYTKGQMHLPKLEDSICPTGQIDFPDRANPNAPEGRPIPDNNTDNNTDNNNNKCCATKRFTAPSLDEVDAYCRERNNGINAQDFIDYYKARGWMLGKVKMKDWKAAVRTWERRRSNGENRIDRLMRDTIMEEYNAGATIDGFIES